MSLQIHKWIFLLGSLKEAVTTNQSAPNILPTTVGENSTVRALKEAITTNKSAPNIPPTAVAENVIEFMHTNFWFSMRELSFVSLDVDDERVEDIMHYFLATKHAKQHLNETDQQMVYKSVQYLNPNENSTQQISKLPQNFVVVASASSHRHWQAYLDLMSRSKINSVIMVFASLLDSEMEQNLTTQIDNLRRNSMFFLTYQKEKINSNLLWYRVITLDGYTQSAINPLSFDSKGKLIDEYDMQGMHIVSITLTWDPYFTIYDCTDELRNCKAKGYLADIMNILGLMMNFTWESHGEKNGDWGTTAKSGPSNSSGVWGGVVGEVFKGNYQLSIR